MPQVTVTYEDGRTETFPVKPKTMIAAERHLGKDVSEHLMEMAFLTGWKASRSPLKFDDWLDTVDNVEQYETGEEPVEVDPTSEPSPDG